MRAEIWSSLFLVGCASTSTHSDLERVAGLSRVAELPALQALDPALDTSPEVRSRLTRPLDAEGAVQIAILQNRELRARLHELGITRGELVQAGLLANPEVEVELLPERDTALELRVEHDLASLLLAPLRADAAKPLMEAARLRLAGDVVQLGFEVRSAFVALQAAEAQLERARTWLESFTLERDTKTALHSAGNIRALDLTTAIRELERSKIEVAELELVRFERREALHRLLGLHGEETTWTLARRLPEVPELTPATETIERRAIEANLELAALQSELQAFDRSSTVLALEAWLPSLHVDVHALHGVPEDRPGATEDSTWRWGGGISLTLPLFDRKQGARLTLEARRSALALRRAQAAVEVRSLAREAKARQLAAWARAHQYDAVILPTTERILDEALRQYNAMQLDVFGLIELRRRQLETELESIEARRLYWTAEAALEALLSGRTVTTAAPQNPMTSNRGNRADGGH